MRTVGDAYDNAMTESFFALLESELLSRRMFKTKAGASMALFTYVEAWYNFTRRHVALGQISPMKFEELHAARAPLEIERPEATGSNDSSIETIQTNDNAILIP
jgi:putative transposase